MDFYDEPTAVRRVDIRSEKFNIEDIKERTMGLPMREREAMG